MSPAVHPQNWRAVRSKYNSFSRQQHVFLRTALPHRAAPFGASSTRNSSNQLLPNANDKQDSLQPDISATHLL